jgi:hypothetical protein
MTQRAVQAALAGSPPRLAASPHAPRSGHRARVSRRSRPARAGSRPVFIMAIDSWRHRPGPRAQKPWVTTKPTPSEEEWTRLRRAPIVAAMAMSLADRAGRAGATIWANLLLRGRTDCIA